MKRSSTASRSAKENRTDWKALRAKTDAQIKADVASDPDTFIPTPAMWKNAKLVMPERKKPVLLRLDGDVLEWFRRSGRGYQTRINAVLRSYVQSRRESRERAISRLKKKIPPLCPGGQVRKRRDQWGAVRLAAGGRPERV